MCDDDKEIVDAIEIYLSQDGYKIYKAYDGEQAIQILDKEEIHLLIMDIMMPKLDGYGVAEEVRKMSDVPIIMLTAKSDERDELRGFDLGIDEYITKPFSPRILVARVEAVLRRTQADADSNVISVDGIEMDIAAHQVKVDGEPIELSYKEFELLNYFLQNRGVALSREKS